MVVLRMARPSYLWIPSLTVLALSSCGGHADDFFSNVNAGAGGASHAGSTSSAGSPSVSGGPSSAGSVSDPGSAGQTQVGSGGAQAGGTSSGGVGGAPTGGGATSSAGVSNGGATNSGGSAGRAAGGSGATAGSAGQKNSAGAGGTMQGQTCNDLIKQATEQLEAARVCRLDADALQCTGKVTNLCDCQVPVQRTESTETRAYLKTLKLIEDKNCAVACTAIVCTSVSNAQCRGSGSSVTGSCVATNHGPSPD
jgi:hypothetical protein